MRTAAQLSLRLVADLAAGLPLHHLLLRRVHPLLLLLVQHVPNSESG